MEPSIINFSDFLENKDKKKPPFKKEEFNDFFIPEEKKIDTEEKIEDSEEENSKIESISEEEEVIEQIESVNESIDLDNFYNVYKDKSEDFSCDISLEGATLDNTKARLILESSDWTLMFEGDIDSKGKCTIPIKKLAILNEGVTGKIRLEVIADGSVFTPWEDDFKVKLSKKVLVKIHENKSNPKKSEPKRTDVKVNVRR